MIIPTKNHGKFMIVPIGVISPGTKFRFDKKWNIMGYYTFKIHEPGQPVSSSQVRYIADFRGKRAAIKVNEHAI